MSDLGNPVFHKVRTKHFMELLSISSSWVVIFRNGTITPATSAWAFVNIFDILKDGKIKVCVD